MNIHPGAAEDFNNFLLFHKIELQADEKEKENYSKRQQTTKRRAAEVHESANQIQEGVIRSNIKFT